MDRTHLPYRRNVGAILRRHDDLILMCERIRPRDTWQFPQGGVDAGESLEESIWRELSEELGLTDPRAVCSLVAEGPATTYDFAPDYEAPVAKKYRGQLQTLFLVDFHGTDEDFALDRHHEPEFRAIQWVPLDIALTLLWDFKRPVLEATVDALAAEFAAGHRSR